MLICLAFIKGGDNGMDDFRKQIVENQIGMWREDNPELFDSVYRQMFGTDYEDNTKRNFNPFDDKDNSLF